MEVWHHVAFSNIDDPDGIVDSLNIKYKRAPYLHCDNYLISFEISEDNPAWPIIYRLIKEKGGVNRFETTFNNQEILDAEWLRLKPTFEWGYPQPKGTWENYTYENYGCRCGTGHRQIAPFHIVKEPHMGKKDFLTLLWSVAIFCTPRVIDALKQRNIKGYEVWPAIIRRTREPSQVISQLFIPNVTNPGLDDRDKHISPADPGHGPCSICGTIKYGYHKRGYMHYRRDAILPGLDFQLSYEWFGTAAFGFREMLISNEVAKIIVENNWHGILLKPVKLV